MLAHQRRRALGNLVTTLRSLHRYHLPTPAAASAPASSSLSPKSSPGRHLSLSVILGDKSVRTITTKSSNIPRRGEPLEFDPRMMDSRTKVAMLREMMTAKRLDAYVIPSEDDHASEYVSQCDERRSYVTHFTGSAGTAIITPTAAYLWTDGRYWLQASQQLDSSVWTLMKSGHPECPPWSVWLARGLGDDDETLVPGGMKLRIGIDPKLIGWKDVGRLGKRFEEYEERDGICGRELVPCEENLVDAVWDCDVPPSSSSTSGGRPGRYASEVFLLDEKYSGQHFTKKLSILREALAKSQAGGLVITALDEIAWMFNLRGDDIPYNPVFFAYAVLTPKECTLFTRTECITPQIKQYLLQGGVQIEAYEGVWPALRSWGKNLTAKREEAGKDESPKMATFGGRREKWVYSEADTKQTTVKGKVIVGTKGSWAVVKALGEDNVEVKRSPVEDAKAVKNSTEIEGFRQCHIRDGAALCRYFAWLEELLHSGGKISEHDAAMQLEAFRKENALFKGLSFATISSTGPNGAVIHYHPPTEGSAIVEREAMYLCDSGAQYLDGTTDTTRTWHFGTPSEEEVRNFTKVLQGHIAIDTVVFPKKTSGYNLDILARRPLWGQGLDYRHGTGHGVGSFLNVHEGPHGIGPYEAYNEVPLKEGMIISNEPGFYADGKYGIRIENMVIVRRADPPNNFQEAGFMEMEHVTMCPIQTSLVDPSLLTPAEKIWLDEYHQEVSSKVKPLLEQFGDERAVAWLERECAPLPSGGLLEAARGVVNGIARELSV